MTEFDDVIRLLRENRPEATELELDQIKQRVRRRTAQRPSRRREAMKSRLAILSMLALGMVFSTTGAGLAVQGFTQDDASVAQYGPDDEQTPDDVLGEDVGGGGADDDLQAARQAETATQTGDQLPFTGFLAIPILIGGVALLTGGLLLRRRTHDD